MFNTVVGHVALYYACETLPIRQEHLVLSVACLTVNQSILDERFRIPLFFFLTLTILFYIAVNLNS